MRLLILLLPLFSHSLAAQDAPMKYGKIPKEDLDMKTYAPDTSAAAVVLCDYGRLTFEFIDNNTRTNLFRHKRIKLLRRSGFGEGNISIPYYQGYTKIKGLKAQVVAPDGTETEVPGKDIFDEKVSDIWRRLRFAFPNLTEGCIIEFKYELESEYITELPEWYFQEEIPVKWSELRLEVPGWYKYVMIQQGQPLDIEETVEKNGSFIIPGGTESGTASGNATFLHTRLVMKNAPAFREESYITTMDDYFARIRFQLKGIQYPDGGYEPILGTWEKVAARLLELEHFGLQFLRKTRYNKVWDAARPRLANASTPEEKANALYWFVQTSFEREENRGIYTRENLDDLFEHKKATPSEMNLLLVALLREAGVTAHPVLISTRGHGQPIPAYPVLDQFDHVLAGAESDGKLLLLDAGNSFRPPGMLAIDCLNGAGWVVSEGSPRWIDITPANSSELYYGIFQLDEEGNLNGKIQVADEGYDAMTRRTDYREKTASAFWKTTLQKIHPDALVDSVTVENPENPDQPLRAHLNCSIPAYAQVSGDFIYINPVFYSSYNTNPFKLEHRIFPVDIPFPLKERIVLDLRIPPGYKVESLPEPARLSLPNNGGRFQFMVKHDGDKVSLNSTFNVSQLHFESDEYDVLRSFFGMVAEKMGEQIVLKKI